MVKVLVISLSSPLLVGIYKDEILVKKVVSDEKASEALIEIFDEILRDFEISQMIYANGPGSFMGIKVAYVILKTISIAKDIPLFGVSGFELNSGGAIRANKNFSFVLKDGEISLSKTAPKEFELPQNLSNLKLNDDILPNYILEAV